jgi:hypothetical protein
MTVAFILSLKDHFYINFVFTVIENGQILFATPLLSSLQNEASLFGVVKEDSI